MPNVDGWRLASKDVHAFLVGESLTRQADVEVAVRTFLQE